MVLPDDNPRPTTSLSERRRAYNEEIQRLVREGAEHASCELVQKMPLRTLEEKVDFVKQLQGLGNALLSGEKLLVIGADQKTKAFVPVENPLDFDSARISQILAKYLQPLPLFEAFNFEAMGGETFVVIAIAPNQPKPFVAKSDVQSSDGRFLLRQGDIWIKENTGLRQASRSDLDAMYEEGAEIRARRWFDKLSNQLLSSYRLGNFQGTAIPQADLIYGDRQTFRLFVQTLIAGSQQRHFLMLVDLLYDLAIDGWNKIDRSASRGSGNLAKFGEILKQHEQDFFHPSVRSAVELGLLLIKHSADTAWLQLVIDLLAEIYESSSRLTKLTGIYGDDDPDMPQSIGPALPALEASIGIRVLAL